MTHFEEFRNFVTDQLKPANLLDEKGAVLYSRPHTLKPGRYYILGLNPGGDAEAGQTIRQRLDRPMNEWVNAYTEEQWAKPNARDEHDNYEKGQHPLQRRLHWLFGQLGTDLNDVCASNLIFVRTPNAAKLKKYRELANSCWPVHEYILKAVQPGVIITFGNGKKSPYRFLQELAEGNIDELASCDSGHKPWACKAFFGTYLDRKRLVVGLPHLSRYDVIEKRPVVDWIKKLA